jgi:hypothetical protein
MANLLSLMRVRAGAEICWFSMEVPPGPHGFEVIMSTYSISCSAMSEHDVALIKSLIGIVGHSKGVEWVYSEDANADVLIVDMDERSGQAAMKASKPKALVAYASPDKTLIPNTFALVKPARARDFIEVLGSIQTKLDSGLVSG